MIIRALRADDIDVVVEFSVRAWRPVFESFMEVMGPDIFRRIYPHWQAGQAGADAIALPVAQPPGGDGAQILDERLGGRLSKLAESGELRGELGDKVL